MTAADSYKIRPAGRHLFTIGRDLIQDSPAAVVELVKNAYDADSPEVSIEFQGRADQKGCSVIIADRGHGMSRDTVINKWMVPSTRDKLDRKISPGGRVMQGHKGIGRYAASILGDDMLLETVTADGEKTTLFVEWASFQAAEYLDDVEVLIESTKVKEPSGTRLTITGGRASLDDWGPDQFKNLQFELKKLISPVSSIMVGGAEVDAFQIELKVVGFPDCEPVSGTVKPYPVFDLYDYRISGEVRADGHGLLEFAFQKASDISAETIPFDHGEPTQCGTLVFDIRVYDRDKESIQSLIDRGLKDERGQYLGNLQARQILNVYNGVGVYRNGFRIRPLGDAGFDWLRLDEQRVQNPSMRIGSNQVIGYVQIQSEERSGLVEKSARDGLKETHQFAALKKITEEVLGELEQRRFTYRKDVGLGRSTVRVERELEQLFSFDDLKVEVSSKLEEGGVDQRTTGDVSEIIDKHAETKNKIADKIRQAVATYQGQATLGKIINVVLHEGRRPLSYFRNQIPNLNSWHKALQEGKDLSKLENIMPVVKHIGENADALVTLFGRLDPLAAAKRGAKQQISLIQAATDSLAVFEQDMEKLKVASRVEGPKSFKFPCWRQDIHAIFTNLVDNSIYWMGKQKEGERSITVEVGVSDGVLDFIDYRDSGPGIEPSLIASGDIFEPQFTTKPQGTGLGLAIAGEAASRNGLEIKALESSQGAWFRLQPTLENDIE